jgi:hypothetical protein
VILVSPTLFDFLFFVNEVTTISSGLIKIQQQKECSMKPLFELGKTKTSALILFIAFSLIGCSGGGGNELTSDDTGDIGIEIETFRVFEGRSTLLTTDFEDGEVAWSQLTGPAVLIDDGSLSDITVMAPWIENGPQIAEFEVSVSINGEVVNRQVNLEILDRRFLVLRVENADDTATDLFLDYISVNDEEGVPEEGTFRLTTVETDSAVCSPKVSPNGQYVAYSIKFSDGIITRCHGIYIVDIETFETTKISQLAQDSSEVEVGSFTWSPDGRKIAYRGDHGSGIEQNYVIDLLGPATSYINYGNNNLEFGQWSDEDLFPVEDAGNPHGLEFIEALEFSHLQWLGNSNGLSLIVTDSVSSDRYPYQASVHGDARRLERFNQGIQEVFEVIPAEIPECAPNSTCTVSGPFGFTLEKINREYVNPRLIETSIEGRMFIISSMLATNGTSSNVLGVREPVIDNADILTATPLEGIRVYDAAWSPVAEDLAFSAELEYRHSHASVEDVASVYDLFGPERPGQLYLFQDYERGHHGESHERLSNPVDSIDENSVVALEWSPQGTHIAYARGEDSDEFDGGLYTSLWVTKVDDVRDQRDDTIDQNTELLLKIDPTNDDFFIRDFKWSPNGEGVLIVIKRYFGMTDTTLRYISRDGSYVFDFQTLTDLNQATLSSIHAYFSPDGLYVAYFDEEGTGGSTKEAIFIQPVDGGDRVRANLEISDGGNFQKGIQWSPHGDAIIYAADSDDDGFLEHYLANVAGGSQNLSTFIDDGSRILNVVTDDNMSSDVGIFPFLGF